MPPILLEFFHRHIYTAVLLAMFAEGLGLPMPAEVMFIAAALMVHQGAADIGSVVAIAVLGNVAGALLGFTVAYRGGGALVRRIARLVRLKPKALQKVERFYIRYGTATIFLTRFLGVIRAATVYTAGAARVAPWKFAALTLSGALLRYGLLAYLSYRFGEALPHLLHGLVRP